MSLKFIKNYKVKEDVHSTANSLTKPQILKSATSWASKPCSQRHRAATTLPACNDPNSATNHSTTKNPKSSLQLHNSLITLTTIL